MSTTVSVLLADDHSSMRKSLRILLDYEKDLTIIGEAVNGEEAIRLAKELAPDIILMDINMKPVNGFEATRKILEEFPQIKILGISLHQEFSYCQNLLGLGVKGYVTKSASAEEILFAVREVAAGRRYIDKSMQGFGEDK